MSYEEIEGKMYFSRPSNSKTFHIFGLDKKSLCGRFMMPFFTPDEDDFITGDEDCTKQDCKKCFDKKNKIRDSSNVQKQKATHIVSVEKVDAEFFKNNLESENVQEKKA